MQWWHVEISHIGNIYTPLKSVRLQIRVWLFLCLSVCVCLDLKKWWGKYLWCRLNFKVCHVCSHYTVNSRNWSSIQTLTPDSAKRLLTTDKWVRFWPIGLHRVTFVLLINISEYIRQHSCWKYAHPSVAAVGWLWIQDFSKNEPKHLYWLGTWHFSVE